MNDHEILNQLCGRFDVKQNFRLIQTMFKFIADELILNIKSHVREFMVGQVARDLNTWGC